MGKLILQRGLGQEVVLKHRGEVIGVIGIARLGEDRVALSFQMPQDVLILRRELDMADSYADAVGGQSAPYAGKCGEGRE